MKKLQPNGLTSDMLSKKYIFVCFLIRLCIMHIIENQSTVSWYRINQKTAKEVQYVGLIDIRFMPCNPCEGKMF